jgi:ribosomal protein L16 Arg81 hydroxylase
MLDFPINAADFRAKYFERAPLLSKSVARSRTWELRDLDRLLDLIEPNDRTLQLFNEGLVPQRSYAADGVELGQPRRRLDKPAVYTQLRAGATLVINRIEAHSFQCRRLCADVGRFAALPTTSNAYLSFSGAGAFGKHWDTHDVFAIQLFGRKRWLVYPPTFPLPLSHHPSESFAQPAAGCAQLDVCLDPGDVLYLPRGWWHQTVPLAQPSFHLSVGTYTATVHDYLMWFSDRFLAQQPGARLALVPELQNAASLLPLLEQLSAAALDANAMRQFQHELDRRERHVSDFDLDSHVARGPGALEGADFVRLLAKVATSDGAQVLVNGRLMKLDPLSAQIVGVLHECPATTLEALCERIAHFSALAVRNALLALDANDVVNIER